jgi:hypothetical protein
VARDRWDPYADEKRAVGGYWIPFDGSIDSWLKPTMTPQSLGVLLEMPLLGPRSSAHGSPSFDATRFVLDFRGRVGES